MVKYRTTCNGKWSDDVIKFGMRHPEIFFADDARVTTLCFKSRAIFVARRADVAVHHSLVLSGFYHP